MTASILLSMAKQFAKIEKQFSEDLKIGFRNGTADF